LREGVGAGSAIIRPSATVVELAGLRHYPLARRGLMMGGLISGFTLATARVDAQVIHTDTAGPDAGETQIPVRDGICPRISHDRPPARSFRSSW
jgi:hypothetical protein